MSTIEEKTKQITSSCISRRIKNELYIMKKNNIFINSEDITITNTNKKDFNVIIKNVKDGRLYNFSIPSNYPFNPPGLYLNNKPYAYYIKFHYDAFKEIYQKYKGFKCFCCETILSQDKWHTQKTLNDIINEVNNFYSKTCEISHMVIIEVIKQKYLIPDINILEWIY